MPAHGLEKMWFEACSKHVLLPSHLYSKDKETKSFVAVVGKTQSFKKRYLKVPGSTGKILFYTFTRPDGLPSLLSRAEDAETHFHCKTGLLLMKHEFTCP